MTRFWFAPILLALGCACGGATLRSAPRMPDDARPCLEGSPACVSALQRAVELGDRARTGQLLVVAARSAPVEQRRDITRAALWLAPDAWVPEELRALLDGDDVAIIASSKGGASRVPPGTVLRLRGATGTSLSGAAAMDVDLAVPEGRGPYGGDAIAGLIAAASGADAALYARGSSQRLVAGAPLLSRLLGTALTLPPGAWESARLCAQADRRLRAGHQAEAWLTLGRAIASLPSDAAPCATRGVLDYLKATVARVSFEGNDSDALADLRKTCIDASVPEAEASTQRYLREILALQTNLATSATELPAPWSSPSGRRTWSQAIDEFARTLGDRRADILRALRDDLLARASEPEGRCDDGWSERVKVQRAAAKEAIRVSGREDLALPTVETKAEGSRVRVVGVDKLLAWVNEPENRWLRVPTLAGALTEPSLVLAPESERPPIEKLCSTAFDEILDEIRTDRLEGYEGRNVTRWFSASRGIAVCRRADSIAMLSDELLRGALQGRGGKGGAVKVLMLTGFHAIEAMINGRPQEGLVAIKVLRDGLERLSKRLGAGDEDRVLDAVIGVVSAAVDRMVTQSGELGVALERAAAALEPIARRQGTPQSPDLVRAAPGLHLGALALLAAVDGMDNDPQGRDAALARLQSSLQRDTSALLSAYGVSEQAPSILHIIKAATTLAASMGEGTHPDLDALFRDIEAASVPGAHEDRWWGVGLNLARLVLWDLAASAVVRSSAPAGTAWSDMMANPKMRLALQRADEALVRLANGVVRDWGKDAPTWEFLYITPAINRGVTAMMTAPEGAHDLGERAAVAMQGELDAGLARMSPRLRNARPDEVGFLAVLLDALEMAHDEGGMQALAKQTEARVRWARRLREQASGYPPEYRIVVQASTAAAEFDADSKKARFLFQQAAQEAAGSQFGDVAWLPRLVEALLLYHDDDIAAALQSVDTILAQVEADAKCDKPHEIVGILPFRAYALERLNRHAEADATLQRYLDATRQFGADGLVGCRLVSYRNAFTFTVDLKQRIGAVFFPTSAEGTFQVGAGYGDARNYDRLACESRPLMTLRLDLAMTAHLMRAAYALHAADDAAANAALVRAIGAGRMIVHGDVPSLGQQDGAAVQDAGKHAFIPMMVYVAAAARGRGHLAAADQLEELAAGIASARSQTVAAALTERPGMPPQLDKLGFDPIDALVKRAWEADKDKKAGAGESGSSVMPPWGLPVVESYALLRQGRAKEAGVVLRKSHVPAGDQVARITVSRAMVKMAGGKRRAAGAATDMQTLARAGMYSEVSALVRDRIAELLESKKTADAIEALNAGLDLVPADRAPMVRADLLLDTALRIPEVLAQPAWLDAMAQVEAELQGRIALQQEVAVLQHILARAAQREDPDAVLAPASRLRGVIERALGTDHVEALKLAVVELMVRSLASPPSQQEVDDLVARVHKAGGAGEPLLNAIDAWRSTRDRPAERRIVVMRFVQHIAGN